jgi:hypothetical protein
LAISTGFPPAIFAIFTKGESNKKILTNPLKPYFKLNNFSENLFRTMSDLVVSEGYAAVGYEYINVDDCWLEKNRGSRGELVADRKRFPSGMRALADYVSFSGFSWGFLIFYI